MFSGFDGSEKNLTKRQIKDIITTGLNFFDLDLAWRKD